ncbi:hypothetical protein [Streptomyces sp. NPDC097619]|uniref:hypothetical protein n=1 Tax=Streptomyces sp. NPDC097619 TaxID=3157228 RepID=UPI00331E115D
MKTNEERDGSVDPYELLRRTDWESVQNCRPGVAPETPEILLGLLDGDPRVQGAALRNLIEDVCREAVLSSAAAPAARYVAAVLPHPATRTPVTDRTAAEEREHGPRGRFPLRLGLLAWLGDTAAEAVVQQYTATGEQADVNAFLKAAPALYEAVRRFLKDPSPEIREAALGALLPLLTLPALSCEIPGLRARVRELAASDGPHRWRAVDTLVYWGEDLSALL